MQIPFKSCLENGMELTFKDLKEKRTKLVEAQWKLQDKLQDKASELLREYSDSLGLASREWTGSDGTRWPYVDIGIWEEKGKFFPVLIRQLNMDSHYHLNFVIATTLDDSPLTGGYRHGISISLWYESSSFYAEVGSGDDVARFAVSSQPGGFYQVCNAIKALISASLDRSMPDVPLN